MITILVLSMNAWAYTADPRLQIASVAECTEKAKAFMPSEMNAGQASEQSLISACRDSDPDCVAQIGDSLHPKDKPKREDYLKLIKACHGKDTGRCFRFAKDGVASFNRQEVSQLIALLQKCE
jgi:hypothetical protein